MSLILAKDGVIPVAELNRAVRVLIEQSIPLLWVAGEISNLTRAASGHWYFTLKDANAQVRCAMFRHKNQYLDWAPENGMQVEARALVTLYEPRGDYQLNVENLRRAGLGALFEAFERLKAKLGAEGLFDAAKKRPLPAFPRCIGVVTSPAAAALKDVLTTLARRLPSLPVVLYPTPVQGEGAAQRIAQAIAEAGRRGECDLLIVCRGGGSIEDLWAFNEEVVARAIAASPIPVVSGVGHETDFTIADFAADRRAPTPTAAAEMASPSRDELARRLYAVSARLQRLVEGALERRMQQLDELSRRLVHPGERLRQRAAHLESLAQRAARAAAHRVEGARWHLAGARQRLLAAAPDVTTRAARCERLAERSRNALGARLAGAEGQLQRLAASLDHLNPLAVLQRGYSLVRDGRGDIVSAASALESGDAVRITFAEGEADARVETLRR
jgi:exodeoxyribonuclease VII large subunit